jgi:hypothetical protein
MMFTLEHLKDGLKNIRRDIILLSIKMIDEYNYSFVIY